MSQINTHSAFYLSIIIQLYQLQSYNHVVYGYSIPEVATCLYELPQVCMSCHVIYYQQVLPPPPLIYITVKSLASYQAGQIPLTKILGFDGNCYCQPSLSMACFQVFIVQPCTYNQQCICNKKNFQCCDPARSCQHMLQLQQHNSKWCNCVR